jgi:hypothetical protein
METMNKILIHFNFKYTRTEDLKLIDEITLKNNQQKNNHFNSSYYGNPCFYDWYDPGLERARRGKFM